MDYARCTPRGFTFFSVDTWAKFLSERNQRPAHGKKFRAQPVIDTLSSGTFYENPQFASGTNSPPGKRNKFVSRFKGHVVAAVRSVYAPILIGNAASVFIEQSFKRLIVRATARVYLPRETIPLIEPWTLQNPLVFFCKAIRSQFRVSRLFYSVPADLNVKSHVADPRIQHAILSRSFME